MQITSITVSAARKMPHPEVDFANLTAFVSLSADIHEGDDVAFYVAQLQGRADEFVASHMMRSCCSFQDSRVAEIRHNMAARMSNATQTTADALAEKYGEQ